MREGSKNAVVLLCCSPVVGGGGAPEPPLLLLRVARCSGPLAGVMEVRRRVWRTSSVAWTSESLHLRAGRRCNTGGPRQRAPGLRDVVQRRQRWKLSKPQLSDVGAAAQRSGAPNGDPGRHRPLCGDSSAAPSLLNTVPVTGRKGHADPGGRPRGGGRGRDSENSRFLARK